LFQHNLSPIVEWVRYLTTLYLKQSYYKVTV
jgi:hypothetical protein